MLVITRPAIPSPSAPKEAFFPALFEQGGAELAMARAVGEVFGGQALDTSTDISSVLRGLSASDLPVIIHGRWQTWEEWCQILNDLDDLDLIVTE